MLIARCLTTSILLSLLSGLICLGLTLTTVVLIGSFSVVCLRGRFINWGLSSCYWSLCMISIIRLRRGNRILFVLLDSLLTVNVLLMVLICNGVRIFVGLVKLGSVLDLLLFLVLILAIINVTLTIVLELATWVVL